MVTRRPAAPGGDLVVRIRRHQRPRHHRAGTGPGADRRCTDRAHHAGRLRQDGRAGRRAGSDAGRLDGRRRRRGVAAGDRAHPQPPPHPARQVRHGHSPRPRAGAGRAAIPGPGPECPGRGRRSDAHPEAGHGVRLLGAGFAVGGHGASTAGRRTGLRGRAGRDRAGVRRTGRLLAARDHRGRSARQRRRPGSTGADGSAAGADRAVALLRRASGRGHRPLHGRGDRRGRRRRAEPGRRSQSHRRPILDHGAAGRPGRGRAAQSRRGRCSRAHRRSVQRRGGRSSVAAPDRGGRAARSGRRRHRGGHRRQRLRPPGEHGGGVTHRVDGSGAGRPAVGAGRPGTEHPDAAVPVHRHRADHHGHLRRRLLGGQRAPAGAVQPRRRGGGPRTRHLHRDQPALDAGSADRGHAGRPRRPLAPPRRRHAGARQRRHRHLPHPPQRHAHVAAPAHRAARRAARAAAHHPVAPHAALGGGTAAAPRPGRSRWCAARGQRGTAGVVLRTDLAGEAAAGHRRGRCRRWPLAGDRRPRGGRGNGAPARRRGILGHRAARVRRRRERGRGRRERHPRALRPRQHGRGRTGLRIVRDGPHDRRGSRPTPCTAHAVPADPKRPADGRG